MKYADMSKAQLSEELASYQKKYAEFKAKGLSLNMARGKPSLAQEQVSIGLLDTLTSESDLSTADGTDVLNYGCLDGLTEIKALFADMLDVPMEKVFVGGNSSLTLMFDYLMQCYAKGASETTEPWILQGDVKILCPVPGYDRHFGIAEYLGITMIPVPMTAEGPDMDVVEELVKDPLVKGMFCVPKYSNPTGITYSDEVVKRIANMETAPDFRVIWDNAYVIHDLLGKHDDVLEILSECEKAGHPDRAVEFTSTSKISFSGAGIAALAANEENLKWITRRMAKQTIGADKINQLRHARYFKNKAGVAAHMEKQAAVITPKFDAVLKALETELAPTGIGTWTNPNGGYFISLDVMEGTAKRVFALCKEAGVTLTNCGDTFPYGHDPKDSNIRIAPSYPSIEELETATELLIDCVKVAALEKLLEQ